MPYCNPNNAPAPERFVCLVITMFLAFFTWLLQGDSSQQGELWGISNLMKFSGESMLIKLRQEHGAGLPPLIPDSQVKAEGCKKAQRSRIHRRGSRANDKEWGSEGCKTKGQGSWIKIDVKIGS